jgi:Flp pilus assembly protein TadG
MERELQSLKTHGERRSRLFGFRISSIGKIAKDESGSASVEFVLLALPLFIPIFIFLNQF